MKRSEFLILGAMIAVAPYAGPLWGFGWAVLLTTASFFVWFYTERKERVDDEDDLE